jgi:capsular polysaccharide export protein
MKPRTILFLQGPASPFLKQVADNLHLKGWKIRKMHFCLGDAVMWWPKPADRFSKRPADWPVFLRNYIENHGVTDIVMLGDGRRRHADALKVGLELGLRIHVFEHGFLRPDWLMVETRGPSETKSGFSGGLDFRSLPTTGSGDGSITRTVFSQSFLVSSLYDLAFHLPNVFLGRLFFPHYITHGPVHPLWEYAGWVKKGLLRRGRRRQAQRLQNRYLNGNTGYFLFALQLVGDYQILNHAPSAGLYEIVNGAIRSFAVSAPPDRRLLFKIHPLDNALHNWSRHIAAEARRHGLEGRVDVIDGGDLNALIDKSIGVVTVNSTVGVTALLALKPVLTLGRAIYDHQGLTHQDSLSAFWNEPSAPVPGLPEAFAKTLIESTHFRGGFIGSAAMETGARHMAERIHANAAREDHQVFAGAPAFRYESQLFGPEDPPEGQDSR